MALAPCPRGRHRCQPGLTPVRRAGRRLWPHMPERLMVKKKVEVSPLCSVHIRQRPLGPFSGPSPSQDGGSSTLPCLAPPPPMWALSGLWDTLLMGPSFLGPQVSALRRLAKPMSERVAGRVGLKSPMLDSGAEVSASTTSSEAESGARSVSSIVHQWNRKANHFLGDHPASTAHGLRPAR